MGTEIGWSKGAAAESAKRDNASERRPYKVKRHILVAWGQGTNPKTIKPSGRDELECSALASRFGTLEPHIVKGEVELASSTEWLGKTGKVCYPVRFGEPSCLRPEQKAAQNQSGQPVARR